MRSPRDVAPPSRSRDLVVRYGAVTAVRGVSFHVAAGEHVTLLGPSGCGKTTTLRAIAGLEQPESGEIRIDGKPVFSSTPRRPRAARAARALDGVPVLRDLAAHDACSTTWPTACGCGGCRPAEVARAGRPGARPRADGRAGRAAAPRSSRAASSSGWRWRAPSSSRPAVLLFDEPLSATWTRSCAPRCGSRCKELQRRARHHLGLRDPRPGGSPRDLRPHRGHARRGDRADRHARPRSTTCPATPSSPTSSGRPT